MHYITLVAGCQVPEHELYSIQSMPPEEGPVLKVVLKTGHKLLIHFASHEEQEQQSTRIIEQWSGCEGLSTPTKFD